MFGDLFVTGLPCIALRRNAIQAIGAGVWTTIQWDTVDYNDGFEYDTTTFEIVVNYAGVYKIGAGIAFSVASTAVIGLAVLFGAVFDKINFMNVVAMNYYTADFIYYINSGTRLKIQCFNNVASNLTQAVIPNNYCSVVKLSQ